MLATIKEGAMDSVTEIIASPRKRFYFVGTNLKTLVKINNLTLFKSSKRIQNEPVLSANKANKSQKSGQNGICAALNGGVVSYFDS